MDIYVGLVIIILLLLVFIYIDNRPCQECMISEAQMMSLSKGFNASNVDDYANLAIIHNAEAANKTKDYTVSN